MWGVWEVWEVRKLRERIRAYPSSIEAEGKRLTDKGFSIWGCPNHPGSCYIF
ncbi:MAG: hypothetical protein F6K41_36955 [Symploca sp. SIO3E6]|nr:hypothetical protein [Caldora sp. SIO3E6]